MLQATPISEWCEIPGVPGVCVSFGMRNSRDCGIFMIYALFTIFIHIYNLTLQWRSSQHKHSKESCFSHSLGFKQKSNIVPTLSPACFSSSSCHSRLWSQLCLCLSTYLQVGRGAPLNCHLTQSPFVSLNSPSPRWLPYQEASIACILTPAGSRA